jgi:hypothetical protein
VKSRWYPVLQRYIDQIGGRVRGFGGDPGKILPSPTGDVPDSRYQHCDYHDHGRRSQFTGKVVGIVYDRFGDFTGFLLLTEAGREMEFFAREHAVEHLVQRAWRKRILITVFVHESRPTYPAWIVLRQAREPYEA